MKSVKQTIGVLIIATALQGCMSRRSGKTPPVEEKSFKLTPLCTDAGVIEGDNWKGPTSASECEAPPPKCGEIPCEISRLKTKTISEEIKVFGRAMGSGISISATVRCTETINGTIDRLRMNEESCLINGIGKLACTGSVRCEIIFNGSSTLGCSFYSFNYAGGGEVEVGKNMESEDTVNLTPAPIDFPVNDQMCTDVLDAAEVKCKETLQPTLHRMFVQYHQRAIQKLGTIVATRSTPYYGPICLPTGTPITLADGQKIPIEKITAGVRLRSFNFETNQSSLSTANSSAISTGKQELITVFLEDGDSFSLSPTHPVWIESKKKWGVFDLKGAEKKGYKLELTKIEAGDVVIRDDSNRASLLASNGAVEKPKSPRYSRQVVKSVKATGTFVEMYDVANVVPDHNFFADDILMHNTTCACDPDGNPLDGSESGGNCGPGPAF